MTISTSFQHINIEQIIILLFALIICILLFTRRKKPTAEEKLQAIQLTRNMAQEMRVIITSIHLVSEMLSKAELNLLKDRKILSFYPEKYEDLCEILDSITTVGTNGIKTVDHILMLLNIG